MFKNGSDMKMPEDGIDVWSKRLFIGSEKAQQLRKNALLSSKLDFVLEKVILV